MNLKITIFLLLSLGLLLPKTMRAQNTNIAQSFIEAMAAKKFNEAHQFIDTSIANNVNVALLSTTWQQITHTYGAYKNHNLPIQISTSDTDFVVTTIFEKAALGFRIVMSSEHKILGFTLVPVPQQKTQITKSLYPEKELSVEVQGGTISGTFMQATKVDAQTSIALIIAGSGPTDRNGNNNMGLHTNCYLQLAEVLAADGISSFRYDKRLIGASNQFNPDEDRLRFDDYVNDAIALVQYLKQSNNTQNIIIIGHSEGALIGALVAQKESVAAYVSLCGAGENIALTLKRQLNNATANTIVDSLLQGKTVQNIPEALQSLFRASIQPYIISWMQKDPAKTIASLKAPTLIIGGTKDIQVPAADAELLKKAAPKATLHIIKDMNHVLKHCTGDQEANIATYGNPDLPLDAELTKVLLAFLKQK